MVGQECFLVFLTFEGHKTGTMYQTKKTYIKPDMKMSDLIIENPTLLLMMEHFELDFVVHNKTVAQVCSENKISLEVYIAFGNLYNGFNPSDKENFTLNDISTIIRFLKNTHTYYKQDKFPEIRDFIKQLYLKNDTDEIKLIEKFFNEYYEEVTVHLDYEEEVVFPYFCELIKQEINRSRSGENDFSVKEYREHHSDIESKLIDLKNLLLKHISLKNDRVLRRKLLFSLFELESDLSIHSLIEEMILIPTVDRIESTNTNG